jgi:hypothetical protein
MPQLTLQSGKRRMGPAGGAAERAVERVADGVDEVVNSRHAIGMVVGYARIEHWSCKHWSCIFRYFFADST